MPKSYLRVNRQYEVLRGVTEAEVKGKSDYDLYAKEIADAVRANDQEVIAADTPLQFEEQVAFADGPHDFIAVKFPLRDEIGPATLMSRNSIRQRMNGSLHSKTSANGATGSWSRNAVGIRGI